MFIKLELSKTSPSSVILLYVFDVFCEIWRVKNVIAANHIFLECLRGFINVYRDNNQLMYTSVNHVTTWLHGCWMIGSVEPVSFDIVWN